MGRETLLYLRDMIANRPQIEIGGFLDDDPQAARSSSLDAPIICRVEDYVPRPEDRAVVAIGDPAVRNAIVEKLNARGAKYFSVVHPTAYVSEGAQIEEGCILAPFTFVGPGARVGKHVILNIYASVGHDALVGDCCGFSPYATVNGNVRLGNSVFLGTHATVAPGCAVGPHSKISSGVAVMRDVPERSLVMGKGYTVVGG
jgi:sugar O-acyltransferase (sialic acid O-acetyltransferase NeuD family)